MTDPMPASRPEADPDVAPAPLTIAARFCGPPRSGNGGYTSGVLAAHLGLPPGAVAAVRLKAPPPLDTALEVRHAGAGATLLAGETVIGEARLGDASALAALAVPPCPPAAQVDADSAAYLGHVRHPFPRCFVCGPARTVGDGLRIFPGSAAGTMPLAAPWTPDASLGDGGEGGDGDGEAEGGGRPRVRPEFVWAALDCPGGLALGDAPAGMGIVLGEMIASIERAVIVGERCTVLGWCADGGGWSARRRLAGTAVFDGQGRLVAKALATWVQIPLAAWQ